MMHLYSSGDLFFGFHHHFIPNALNLILMLSKLSCRRHSDLSATEESDLSATEKSDLSASDKSDLSATEKSDLSASDKSVRSVSAKLHSQYLTHDLFFQR